MWLRIMFLVLKDTQNLWMLLKIVLHVSNLSLVTWERRMRRGWSKRHQLFLVCLLPLFFELKDLGLFVPIVQVYGMLLRVSRN